MSSPDQVPTPPSNSRRYRLTRRLLWAVAAVSAALLVMGLVFAVAYVASTVETIRDTQKTSAATGQRLLDCTEPTGKCYREGQQRTAEAVADIGKVAAYAAACADLPGVQTTNDVLACVLDRLEAEQAKRDADATK